MSQQGGRPTGHEDEWWGQLYDDSTGDTGPAPAPDSLDDRFASAAGTVGEPEESDGAGEQRPASGSAAGGSGLDLWLSPPDASAAGPSDAQPVLPEPRAGADDAPDGPRSADGAVPGVPGEPPSAQPTGPAPAGTRPTTPAPGTPWTAPPAPAGPPSAAPGPVVQPPSSRAHDNPPPPVAPPGTAPDPGAQPRVSRPPAAPPVHAAPPAPADPGDQRPTSPPAPVPPPPSTALSATGFRAPPPPFAPHPDPDGDDPGPRIEPVAPAPRVRGHVGARPPTYDAEPTALPAADPDELGDLVADTVLDGARYGACTLRAASVRGDSARYRGEPRRDSLLTARFGTGERALVLVAMATGARATRGAHRAAAEACQWIGRAVGRSHARLVDDIRGGRRGDLRSGLHRLTDRSLGRLRASAAEQGVEPEEYAASLRCLLLSGDPACPTRVFFGVGPGGLFRLREGAWQDIEPRVAEAEGGAVVGFGSPPAESPGGDRLTLDLGVPTPPSAYEPAPEPPREPFRFRTSIARPGDTLLMCSAGLADPLRGEPELGDHLADRWSGPEPPGLAAFLADSQVRVKGYADDRTLAAVWEA
ncbi:protein phosphatase 2C domain-containing protein [Streptomyces sp. NPDC058741]|uniref:protein phosphatase 2C domain-containing protein n=1 Tax=unclassified Streptomyces TaxID=2593676 RepID=UPI00369F2169